jgi:hypothetical protein
MIERFNAGQLSDLEHLDWQAHIYGLPEGPEEA